MYTLCQKCGRKIIPVFANHIYNGNEKIKNGSENIMNGHKKTIANFMCPFCDKYHKQGIAKE